MAEPVPVPAELAERLAQEKPLLRQAFPAATIDAEGLTLTLASHRLPPGWSRQHTEVLIAIPVNYPAGQPDNVCVRPDLTLTSGAVPGNCQGIQTHAGRPWLQLSYHVHPADWRPRADPAAGSTLADYLAGALTRLDEAS
ncbi:E2/UBC family protein [Jatrophihabitans sp.]|uniref:E2/UBC family protein n=1 Tax=Jatrophihabitans sp. TaxID=1932789 RepID=UPI002BD35672|nr:E2/UBC family protein [Jatrophihabitans sp.]